VRFDPFDGRCINIVIAQAIGIGGKPFRKRADGLLRRLLCRLVLRARDPRTEGERGSARCQVQKSSAREFHGVSLNVEHAGFGAFPCCPSARSEAISCRFANARGISYYRAMVGMNF
jgi:hypothetical protein